MTELRQVDLNLLVALDALIDECSVTRAAERTGVTQPAMSHTLKRLRALFDDPLLVRAGGGMALTPRAEALAVELRAGLHTLQRVLEPPGFDPASARRTFRLASPDLFDALALPRVLARMRAEAPGVDLVVSHTTGDGLEPALASGDLDLAVLARAQLEAPGALVGKTLFHDTFSCFLRRDHPALEGGALTVQGWLGAPHALVSPRGGGGGPVDAVLDRMGLARRVALRLPHFTAAPRIIADSDLILMAPTALARTLSDRDGLVVLPAPVSLPSHAVMMTWHPRFSGDPGHVWLRNVIAGATEGMEAEPQAGVDWPG